MRKGLLLLMFIWLSGFAGFAQTDHSTLWLNEDGTSLSGQDSPGLAVPSETDAITRWVLPILGGGSTNSRIPRNNTYRYQKCEYLITPSEMAASGFPSGYTVDAITFSIGTAGVGTQTGELKIYMKNTSDASYTLGSSWTTTDFTLVHSAASFTVPYAAGNYMITFSGGSSFTYTGGGVYVAWEFNNPSGTLPTGSTALLANCNGMQTTACYGVQTNTAGTTAMSVTSYRPATQFTNNTLIDVLQVTNIYAQEKCPMPYGVPTNLSARVANVSAGAETFNVTMTITDQATSTVRYTSVQTVTALAGGSAVVVSFPPWTPDYQENVNITVTVPTGTGESFLNNNTLIIPANINGNVFGYAYNPVATSGYGFTYNGAGGIFANRFHMNGQGSIPSANIHILNNSANTGRTVYAVVMNSTGTIVAQSANLVIAAGNLGTNVNFTFPTPPNFTSEDFYVGLAQPPGGTAQWWPMGVIDEIPYRANTYYSAPLAGGSLTPRTSDSKLLIEAQVAPAVLPAHDAGTISIDLNQVFPVGTVIPKATVKNFGANTETFTVTMTIGDVYSSTQTVTALGSGLTTQVTFDPWNTALGDYTMGVCTALATDLDESNDCKSQNVRVTSLNKQVYAYLAFANTGSDPVGPVTFNLSTPGIITSLANQASQQFISGGTWANNIWYGTVYNTVSPYNFITVDPVTGARTVIGNMGVSMNGLSYNPANNTMYAVTATSLYTVDMTTGAVALIGTNTGINMINLAINSAGQAYSVDITADVLGSVNLATGVFTPIGSIGFNASYAQDMEFDRESGELFMAAYGAIGYLGVVNTATGQVLKVGEFEGSGEITGLAIPYPYTPPLAVTGTPVETLCYGSCDGSLATTVSGGVPPYTYLWNTGETTSSLTGLCAGTYTVTVTDSELSYITGSWTVNSPSALSLSNETVVNVTCFEGSDGSISLTAAGSIPPYTFFWNTGATTSSLSGLSAGNYLVTITDAHACTFSSSYIVDQGPNIIFGEVITHPSCPEINDGSIDLSISGGNPPYTLKWNTGEMTEDLTGLAPGTYTVVVTDNASCEYSGSWTLTAISQACPTNVVSGTLATTQCYDASQTIYVAGAAGPFLVQATGSATLIAGVRIFLYEGTTVLPGGSLHGYIAPGGPWCPAPSMPAVTASASEPDPVVRLSEFRLYPNPSKGNVTVVLNNGLETNPCRVQVFTMSGSRVLDETFTGVSHHEIQTTDLPAGLYFVKLTTGQNTQTIKLVKTR